MYLAHNSIAMMEHFPDSPDLVPVAFLSPECKLMHVKGPTLPEAARREFEDRLKRTRHRC